MTGEAGSGAIRRWWRSPRVRRRVAQVVAIVGTVMVTVGAFTGRYGWLAGGLVVVVIAVASAPWRLRRSGKYPE